MVYIYCIEFENGKKYVGKTRNLKERWEQHRKGIACPSTATQNFNNAKFILEDIVPEAYIAEHEQKWIDKYGGINEDGVLLNRINAISKTKKNKNKTEKIFEAIDRVHKKNTIFYSEDDKKILTDTFEMTHSRDDWITKKTIYEFFNLNNMDIKQFNQIYKDMGGVYDKYKIIKGQKGIYFKIKWKD